MPTTEFRGLITCSPGFSSPHVGKTVLQDSAPISPTGQRLTPLQLLSRSWAATASKLGGPCCAAPGLRAPRADGQMHVRDGSPARLCAFASGLAMGNGDMIPLLRK